MQTSTTIRIPPQEFPNTIENTNESSLEGVRIVDNNTTQNGGGQNDNQSLVEETHKELKTNKLNSIANTGSQGSMENTQMVGGA